MLELSHNEAPKTRKTDDMRERKKEILNRRARGDRREMKKEMECLSGDSDGLRSGARDIAKNCEPKVGTPALRRPFFYASISDG